MRKAWLGIFVVLLVAGMMQAAVSQELIVNGGMEGGPCGWWEPAAGWSQNGYDHALSGTTTTNVHGGTYSYTMQLVYVGSTVPIMYQSFSTSAHRLKISGWVRADDATSGGSMRIRENKTTGAAGTVRYYNGTAWTTNAVDWVDAASFTSGDTMGIRYEHTLAFMGNTAWTKFELSVPTLPGVTDYAIDLSADQTWSYSVASTRTMIWDDISVSESDEALVNGGMEGGPKGTFESPAYWSQLDYSHILAGTTTTNVHGGDYSYVMQLVYPGSTVPIIFQSFKTYAPLLRVSGWVRADDSASGGSVRIRENEHKLGPGPFNILAGTARYYNGTAWTTNAGNWANAGGFYDGNTAGIRFENTLAFLGNTAWTKFDVTVPTLSGVTDYAIDLSADQTWSYTVPSSRTMIWDDISVAEINMPGGLRRPFAIDTDNNVVVDGNLNDWADAKWAPLEYTYDGAPTDIPEAYYAAKWNSADGRIYMAAKVRDTNHSFNDSFDVSNPKDSAEFYIHTTGRKNAVYGATQEDAQEYVVGIKASNHNQVWACLGNNNAIPPSANFDAAGKENGQWLQYEVAVTPFQYFGGLVSQANINTILKAGDGVGLDVTAVGNAGGTYTGMKAENTMTGKWNLYDMIGRHWLQVGSTMGTINDVNAADDGKMVDISNAVASSIYYGDTATTYPGVAFGIQNPDRSAGLRVAWQWEDGDTTRQVVAGNPVSIAGVVRTSNGEKYVEATSVVAGNSVLSTPEPLSMTGKASAGLFPLYDNVDSGALSSGLSSMGLLVKIVGKVTYISSANPLEFSEYFYIDDGSKMKDGSGNVGIRCRTIGDSWGPLYMPDQGRYVAVTGIVGSTVISGKSVRYFWTNSWEYLD